MKALERFSEREQKMLKWGVMLVVVALLWAFVYLPSGRNLEAKQQRTHMLQMQLEQMKSSQPTGVTRQALPIDTGFSAWVDQQMVGLTLQNAITRAEPQGDSQMTLWLQNVPFDVVIDWLHRIEGQYAVSSQQLDVVLKDKAAGLCDMRMTLVK